MEVFVRFGMIWWESVNVVGVLFIEFLIVILYMVVVLLLLVG